jgi:hypothetical protein
MNIFQRIKRDRRDAVLAKRKPGAGSNVKQSRPAQMKSNPPSYDPSGRYNSMRSGVCAVRPHGRKWQQGGNPRGRVIASQNYSPQGKTPSQRDQWRIEVAERKAANQRHP